MPTPKQMLIIEHLVTSPPHKSSASFLTKQQAQEKLDKMLETHDHGTIITHTIRLGDTKYYFFSNDHCFGYIDEMNKLKAVPWTISIPMLVKPREILPSGTVTSVDEFIAIFYPDEILIDDFMQLVELIDKHNLLTTDKF